MPSELILIGLQAESILPGEERSFAPPAIDPATLKALSEKHPKRLCAVTVTSAVELPELVAGRFATECQLVSADAEAVVLRGEARVRIVRGSGQRPPFLAEVEAQPLIAHEPAELARAGHALWAALGLGAPAASDEALREAAAASLRAAAGAEQLREAARQPLHEAMRALADSLMVKQKIEHASCELEAALQEAASAAELSTPQRRRLWSSVVEVQRKLGVYDPGDGERGDEVLRLQRRLQSVGLPPEAREVAKSELKQLLAMESSHHDYSHLIAHLDLMAKLAWHPAPLPPLDLEKVEKALEKAHAGLEKPKRRVLEHLAMGKLGGRASQMVLCLAGPPGVGKTTIARSIAEALGRKFVRVPLGGVHDECEVRGHRKSFTAAGPGRLIAGFAQAGTATPVVLLDEVDKIGTDQGRSPSSALLEVLDPEQNSHFSDNFLAVPFDISHALFICTANDVGRVGPALLDRMEVVELDGYTVEEKLAIVRDHLLERLRADHGLKEPLALEDATVVAIVEGYTREGGVRELQRCLAALCRDRVLKLVRGGQVAMKVEAEELAKILGPAKLVRPPVLPALPPGVVNGLSVGDGGGSLLTVEVGSRPGKGELHLTGRLGEVMRESAQVALAQLRIAPAAFGLEPAALECDFHLHIPEGAVVKEGPSAGLGVLLALCSAARKLPLPADLAVTGEISLTGRVLAVGGVRAKLLAAERAGMKRVLIPRANLAEVPPELRAEVLPVEQVSEALAVAFPGSAMPDPGRRAKRQMKEGRAS